MNMMNTQAKIIVAVLVVAVVALGVTVGVMAASDGDRETTVSSHTGMNDAGYPGMMGAMGSMNSDDMLKHMREVLGEDAYQRMLAHMTDHRNGASMSDMTTVDQMMHRMMDGMMQNMPMGGGMLLPPGNGMHNESPAPAATPTPAPTP